MIARAAEMGRDLLAPLERRVPGPSPPGRVVRLDARTAPHVQSPIPLDCLELLVRRERNPVQHNEFVEGARLTPLHARAVVAKDVDDERVVPATHAVDGSEDAANLVVGVLLEAGKDLHLPAVELLLFG